MNTTTKDRRSRKTEAAIEKAFFELAAKKDINKITVKDITDLADTNRGTFYLHYLDILDLQDKLENKIINELCSLAGKDIPAKTPETLLEKTVQILTYIRDNRAIIKPFFNSGRSMLFMNKLTDAIETRLLPEISHNLKEQPHEFRRRVSLFFVNGAAALIYDWIKNDSEVSPEELGKEMARIINTGLSAY